MEPYDLLNDMAWICTEEDCGSTRFHALKSGKLECCKCGRRVGEWELTEKELEELKCAKS